LAAGKRRATDMKAEARLIHDVNEVLKRLYPTDENKRWEKVVSDEKKKMKWEQFKGFVLRVL
jgi:hypothetical protein